MKQPTFSPRGIYSAQWTPVDGSGRVDRASLAAHLDFERSAGIHGILALGSTGEFPYFTLGERKHALALLAELAAPLPVIANVSDIQPRAAVELGRFARGLGVAAIALMPPMFYPVSQADMLAYFRHIADAVGMPVMLYNFPELVGKRIAPATVVAFAEGAPMVAIKQSGGELSYHRDLIALGREKGFVVMSGADTHLPYVFGLGASGCIGGLVNIVPELMVQLYHICVEGHAGDAGEAAARMTEVGAIVDQLTFPLNIAAALKARGFAPGVTKAILSKESASLSGKIVQELRNRLAAWKLKIETLDQPAAITASR